ncbi:hypothetical protein ACFL08_05895, partial [Patescibacteria group bacterium]
MIFPRVSVPVLSIHITDTDPIPSVAVFAVAYIWRGEDAYTIFITSIALVVSAVPEGLLPAITIILVLAMRRLSRKKALIRKLDATEGMGS